MSKTETASAESMVVLLWWAKSLKMAGWPQEYDDATCTLPHRNKGTYFCWENTERPCSVPACNCGKTHGGWVVNRRDDNNYNPFLAAPTALEILEKLPKEITVDGFMYCLEIYFCGEDHYSVGYAPHYTNKTGHWLCDFAYDNLHDCSAELYCYLAENNLLPPTK